MIRIFLPTFLHGSKWLNNATILKNSLNDIVEEFITMGFEWLVNGSFT